MHVEATALMVRVNVGTRVIEPLSGSFASSVLAHHTSFQDGYSCVSRAQTCQCRLISIRFRVTYKVTSGLKVTSGRSQLGLAPGSSAAFALSRVTIKVGKGQGRGKGSHKGRAHQGHNQGYRQMSVRGPSGVPTDECQGAIRSTDR